jgi:hypothetical protein
MFIKSHSKDSGSAQQRVVNGRRGPEGFDHLAIVLVVGASYGPPRRSVS